MGTYTWLKLVKGSTLVLPGLTDHGNQPLVFRSPVLIRRCVTKATFENPLVQRYVAQGMLVVDADMSPKAAAPAAEPTAVKLPPPPPATSVISPVDVVIKPGPEPVVVVESAPQPPPEPEPVVVEETILAAATVSDDSAPMAADQSPEPALSTMAEAPKSTTDTPRRRRRG